MYYLIVTKRYLHKIIKQEMLKKIIYLLFLVNLSLAITSFNLVSLPKTNGSMCMDGSAAGLYIFDPDADV